MNHLKLSRIKDSIHRLESHIVSNNYLGLDPYDGLMSPLFSLPILNSNKPIRFLAQQFVKRFPINLRPILGIKPGENPVTLGLCIQAYSNLLDVFPEKKKYYLQEIDLLINRLEKRIPSGFAGSCWGYDFHWAARNANIPAYQPTVVATGIISNALFINWQQTGNDRSRKHCLSAAEFVIKNLQRTIDSDGDLCFSYSPFDRQVVYNASLKGARILAQANHISENPEYKILAKKAVAFVMKNQRNDGAWVYSKAKSGGWVDNYHTGYVLDCAHDYSKYTSDTNFDKQIELGYVFYEKNFFDNNEIPKFYDKNTYPIDCTSASQSLFTLCRFGNTELAQKVAIWMVKNMQGKDGSFYFRKYQYHTEKTPFMRWSNAWMFAALSHLLLATNKPK